METVEVVIRINKNTFDAINELSKFVDGNHIINGYQMKSPSTVGSMITALAKGTVLPKGRGKRMTLKKRTPEERKAYVEGYNACNETFRKYLKQERSVEDAIKTMDVFAAAVNGAIGKEESIYTDPDEEKEYKPVDISSLFRKEEVRD